MSTVTCNKCNWVHVEVTRKAAEQDVKRFNEYFNSLTKEKQNFYYGGKGSSIESYEHCMSCNNKYTDFRPSKPGDCPNGCTLNPIIRKQD
jgi:hypothetical protein